MNLENLHRLLKRQIKQHFGNLDQLPEGLDDFLDSINEAYKDYDKDLSHTENILKISSQELFKANKELKGINESNQRIIEEKTRDLKRITHNLQSAEKIAMLGNLTLNLQSNQLEISDQLIELLNLSEFHNKSFEDFINLFENSAEIKNEIFSTFKEGQKVKITEIRKKDDNRIFTFEGQIISNLADFKEDYFIGVVQDISLVKQHENSLYETLQSVENYKKAIDQAGIVSIADRTGKITYVNSRFTEISEYSESELIGSQHNIVNSGFHDKQYFSKMWQTIASGKVWKGIFRNKSKSGKIYWVDSTIVPFIKDGKVDQYFSIRFDITEKMQIHEKVEEQKNFYEGILNNIPVDIAVFDLNQRYLFVNPIGVKNPEVRQFLIGKTDFDYCLNYGKDLAIAEKRKEIFDLVKSELKMTEFIDESIDKEGKKNYHLRRFFPVLNPRNELTYLIGFGINITDKREQEIKIKNSLEEKEALLGEVHHRVKNNLALVMGLIELQSSKTENDFLRSEFNEIQNRISAMALIHEKLYKSQDFAKIELDGYIQDLVRFLNGFYNKGKDVNVSYDLEKILVSTKKAVPLALITNELVTNAFKYAFSDEGGELSVKLSKIDDDIIFEVKDNGPGISSTIDPAKTKSLGFKLLSIFVKQLKGKYELINQNGLKVIIKFKNEQENSNS